MTINAKITKKQKTRQTDRKRDSQYDCENKTFWARLCCSVIGQIKKN